MLSLIKYYRLPLEPFETLRTKTRQKLLIEQGFSKTYKSKHLANAKGFCEAIDFVVRIDGKWSWDNDVLHYYIFFGELVTREIGEVVEWGGHWKSFKDYPHFQFNTK
jgi:peptidoglycan L-alanyl-D-glutamate endopeptidase CwlK